MPESDVTVSAEFSPVIPAREPYIDESGAYRLGNIEYVEIDGEPFSITEDGTVGEKLDDVTLSYFDFLLRSDDTYQITYYTGPKIDGELVIPKTFNGKPITVLGNNDNNRLYESGKTQFSLVLNENITEIRTKYIAEKGEEKYDQLVALVKTMLDYGSKAQLTFDRNTDALANGGTDYFTDTVNASDIASTMSNMTENLSSYGLEYTGTTIVYLTETSIRHYYTITDQDTFDLVKDNITFDGVKVGYTKKGNEIYFEKKGVAAADLDVAYTFSIGTNSYDYAVLDYVKRCLESDKVKPETKELVAATFRYNQAANTYFGR